MAYPSDMITPSQVVDLANKDANRLVGPVMCAGTLPDRRQQLNSFAQDPEWLRVPEAVRRFGLGRSTIYELIRSHEVKTALIRKRGNTTGIRLISTDSLRAYVQRFVEGNPLDDKASTKIGFGA
jgi:hypothetical protein